MPDLAPNSCDKPQGELKACVPSCDLLGCGNRGNPGHKANIGRMIAQTDTRNNNVVIPYYKAKGLILADEKAKPQPLADGWDSASEVQAGWEDTYSFETIGDVFIGTYEGNEETVLQNGDTAIAAIFTMLDSDGDGLRVGIWANHDLRKKLSKVEPGTLTRIEYVSDREVHKGLTAMKEFSVKTR